VGGKTRAVVVDGERERAIGAGGRDANEASLGALGDAMLDSIFNHELQDKRGHLGYEKIARYVDGELESVDESDLLNVEILLSKFHLFRERHLLTRWVSEKASEKVT